MRLLHFDGERLVSTDFRGKTPPYAILSHRWGDSEVLYEDLAAGACKDKAGYRKIEFCAAQAAQDQLQYFWIDTCCIDKWGPARALPLLQHRHHFVLKYPRVLLGRPSHDPCRVVVDERHRAAVSWCALHEVGVEEQEEDRSKRWSLGETGLRKPLHFCRRAVDEDARLSLRAKVLHPLHDRLWDLSLP